MINKFVNAFLFLSIIFTININSQDLLLWGDLKPGKYSVGFKVINKVDHSRPIKDKYDKDGNFLGKNRGRPIQMTFWYPAEKSSSKKLIFEDYVKLSLKEIDFTKEITEKDKADIVNNMKSFLMGSLFSEEAGYEDFKDILKAETYSLLNADPIDGKFPILLIAQGNTDSPHRFSLLAEYVASYGFVVASHPSSTRLSFYDPVNEHAEDIEFVLNYAYEFPNADKDKLAILGFSLGGNSGGEVLMRNSDIDAALCLDCGWGSTWATPTLKRNPLYPIARNRQVAFLDFRKGNDARVDPSFVKSYKYSDAYFFEIGDFRHFNFTSTGMLAALKPELATNKQWIYNGKHAKEGYEAVMNYTLNFLEAYLKNNKEAKKFLDKSYQEHGFDKFITSAEVQKGIKPGVPSTSEFSRILLSSGVDAALKIFSDAKKLNPDVILFDENSMNNIIYSRFMNEENVKDAIKLFKMVADSYPNSANVWDSLAEAYMLDKQNSMAIKYYKKSLELDPQNLNAEEKLKILVSKE